MKSFLSMSRDGKVSPKKACPGERQKVCAAGRRMLIEGAGRGVSFLSKRFFLFAAPAMRAVEEEGEHGATFLGLPLWIWQLANLAFFLGLLFYFVARPLAAAFRKRQLEVEERLKEAESRRAEAARLHAEIHERLARLDSEIAEIRARGVAEGEAERGLLLERSEREAQRVRREAEEEIGRRLESAKDELRRVAADLTASSARELVTAQITQEDRQRLLEESVEQMGESR